MLYLRSVIKKVWSALRAVKRLQNSDFSNSESGRFSQKKMLKIDPYFGKKF